MDFEDSLRLMFHIVVTTSLQTAVLARMRGASPEEALEAGMEMYADFHTSGKIVPTLEDVEQMERIIRHELQLDVPQLPISPPRSLQ